MSCAPSIGLRLRSDQPLHTLKVYSGAIHPSQPFTNIPVIPTTTSYDVVKLTLSKLGINERPAEYQLAEVTTGEDVIRGERRLGVTEKPMELQNKWNSETANKFYLRRKVSNVTTTEWIHRSEDLTSLRDVFQGQREAPHDLCELSTLTEENLLESLKTRFSKDVIYTYVNTILIAVNPFKDLPIYDVDLVHKYNNKRNRSELAPHVFAVANTALRNMLETRKNQCMVISGESGSGKTETTRHIIHWLTTTQNKRSSTLGLAQSILGAGELLEAFGNAQTSRNKNSSRFGRFIQLEYRHDGSVHGAVIDKYLLEKSRITNISVKERSYHVFYYLLAGCPQQFRQEFQLKSVEQFNYLNQSACTVDGMDDAEGFVKLQRSMNMVGIIEEQQSSIFKVLSAILHLGNITFKKHNNLRTSEECVVIADKEALQTVAEMLSVRADLLQAALTTRKSFTRGEQFITHYKMFDATATRDTLAKSLYTYLFDWLLSHVNQGLVSETRTAEKYLSIGLLDIFGFEDFKTGNRFEQFCINYANEQLQHFFDQHIFKLEQAEYRSEGIRWTMIDYQDNTSCLELFHGKPIGLLHLLDEENSFPGGTDASLLQKFNDQHTSHEKFVALPLRENQFGIQHYAGGVTYNIDEFLEKNRGHMRADIVHVLKSSTSLFIKKLIGCDPVALARWALLRNYVGAVFACRNAIQSYTADPKDTAIVFRSKKRSSDSDGSRSVRDRASAYSGLITPTNSAYMCENQPELSSTSSSVSSETDLKLRRTSDSAMSHLNNYQSPTAIALARQNRIKFQPLRATGTVRGRRQPRSTVVGQFMTSLTSLVKVLNSGSPHFIRCIKSNYSGKPEEFEDEFVLRQLRYTGMLETIQIRKASYSVRFNIEEFCTQFRLLMRESGSRDVATFFEWMKLDRRQYQIGTNKVFMRDGPLQVLNEYQDRLILQRVTMIQRKVRAWFWRRKFLQMRAAALLIQRRWREYSARERAAAITLIASVWRMYRVRKSFLQQREAAIKIQRGWRNYKNIELPPPAPTPTRYSELLLGDSPILSNNQNQVYETVSEYAIQ